MKTRGERSYLGSDPGRKGLTGGRIRGPAGKLRKLRVACGKLGKIGFTVP